jgi:hypothetical protein
MKRPNDDFRGRVRGPGRLKEESTTYEETIVPVKPDVDNFGALFVDNAQVVALHMYKLRDNKGMCNGRMQIECSIAVRAIVSCYPFSWMSSGRFICLVPLRSRT